MGQQGDNQEDPEITLALKHPLRQELLQFWERPAGDPAVSPRQASEELRQPLSHVAYHVRVLRKAGLLLEEDQIPTRGSIKHLYRLDPERARLPAVARVLEGGSS